VGIDNIQSLLLEKSCCVRAGKILPGNLARKKTGADGKPQAIQTKALRKHWIAGGAIVSVGVGNIRHRGTPLRSFTGWFFAGLLVLASVLACTSTR